MATINSNVRLLVALLTATSAPHALAQTLRLGANEPSPVAEFGFATAVQGGRVVNGSPGEAGQRGAVYLHECVAGQCAAAVRLVAGDLAAGDQFGSAVALSLDTLAVAAPGQEPAAVYVFVRNGPVWIEQARIAAPDGTLSAGFGSAVALAGDRLVIGADAASDGAGAAYAFARSGSLWTPQARLAASNGAPGDRFGSALSLSGDSLLVGAPQRAGVAVGSHARGAAYVFVETLGVWSEQAQLIPVAAADGDSFGAAVGLHGERALIGAPLAGSGIGRAYVFQRAAGAWSEQAQLGANDGVIGDRFGWSVALGGDSVVVGAPFARATCGASYRFQRSGALWMALADSSAAVPVLGSLAGWSVSADGGRYIVGAPGFSGAADHRGAGYWFDPIEQIFADGLDNDSAVTCVIPGA